MNCRNCEQYLSAFLDNELSGEQMLKLRAHISECSCCQRELDDLRELKAMLNRIPCVEPTVGFEQRLSSRVFELPVRRTNRFTWAAVGVAAACAIAFASFQMISAPAPQEQVANNSQTTLQEDQALAAAGDPLSGQAPMVTSVSYGDR